MVVFGILHSSAYAEGNKQQNLSNDFGNSNASGELSVEDLRYRVQISGQIFVTDSTGKRILYQSPETREWGFGGSKEPLVSNWGHRDSDWDQQLAIRHEWTLQNDGTLKVKIEQFDKMENKSGQVTTGKLLKTIEKEIIGFEPITFQFAEFKGKKAWVRLTPFMWDDIQPIDLQNMPLIGRNLMVYDVKGNIWARRVNPGENASTYFGISTHRGSLFLSYKPFPGAQKIGVAEKNLIKISGDNFRVEIASSEPFLPRGVKANVYGLADLSKKTEKLQSVRTMTTDRESQFIKYTKSE